MLRGVCTGLPLAFTNLLSISFLAESDFLIPERFVHFSLALRFPRGPHGVSLLQDSRVEFFRSLIVCNYERGGSQIHDMSKEFRQERTWPMATRAPKNSGSL